MDKYLFSGSYTPESLLGRMVEGVTNRIGAAKEALGSVGGELDAFYFAFGDFDFYFIVDAPDNVSTTTISWAGNMNGPFKIKSVVLRTPEEGGEVVKKAVTFRSSGE